jgi:MarR family transcriptional regulator, 2-MHQ and catechol-resistance regulon repressor
LNLKYWLPGEAGRAVPTHYPGTESEVRALGALINLVRASDSLRARLSLKLEASGLTAAQFGVLESIYHLGPMCQKTVAKKLLRSGGNITVVVDNLERHGLVRRERQADDRRMVEIHLTPRGRKLIEHVFPRHVEEVVKEFSALDPGEQEELRRLCRKLGKASR